MSISSQQDPARRSNRIHHLTIRSRRALRSLWRHTPFPLTVSFCLWLITFTAGLTIPSQPVRDLLVASYFEINEAAPPPDPSTDDRLDKSPMQLVSHAPPSVMNTDAAAVHPAIDPEDEVLQRVAGRLLLLLVHETPTAEADEIDASRRKIIAQALTEALRPSAEYAPESKPSEPRKLRGATLAWMTPLLMLAIMFSYTPTNLVLLCVFGAMMGAASKQLEHVKSQAKEPPTTVVCHAAVVNGLCVFLALFAGLIVVQGTLMFDTSRPDLYQRLAATATLLSIFAGANPKFLDSVRTLVPGLGQNQSPRPSGAAVTPQTPSGSTDRP